MASPTRTLAHFTVADAETLLGRPITDQEERHLVKVLANTDLMADAFAEALDTATSQER